MWPRTIRSLRSETERLCPAISDSNLNSKSPAQWGRDTPEPATDVRVEMGGRTAEDLVRRRLEPDRRRRHLRLEAWSGPPASSAAQFGRRGRLGHSECSASPLGSVEAGRDLSEKTHMLDFRGRCRAGVRLLVQVRRGPRTAHAWRT